ncbi:hypothetical protein N9E28_02365, partial [Alphaproteobacteria bacterium]|nr:hypothetical protein [Alphaproteobacteria bacterium]
KRGLAELDERMLNALDRADAHYFRNAYSKFFEDFYDEVVNQGADTMLPETTEIEPQADSPKQNKDEQKHEASDKPETQIIGNLKVIAAPQRAYFNRDFRAKYVYGLGKLIEAETVFVRFVDGDESISIKTSKPSVISRLFLDDGERISSSGQNICEVKELDHYDYRRLLEESKKSEDVGKSGLQKNQTSQAQQLLTEPRNAESRLRDLKKLYAKKLITKAVYEKKQEEILLDL